MTKIVVLGAGAAGFFGAIAAARACPHAKVLLLEKNNTLLSKVKISGGGRCNVTHACFDPKKLIHNYPRGHRELLSCFMRFQPQDTIAWFEEKGVFIKTEEDGRCFPITDRSETIVKALTDEAALAGVTILTQQHITSITKQADKFQVDDIEADKVLLATGSHPSGHRWAESLGHSPCKLVPSLFTFNTPDSNLLSLTGITIAEVTLKVLSHTQRGPLLLTHWGFSGPSVLKLSAFAARDLHEVGYNTPLEIQWAHNAFERLMRFKADHPTKQIGASNPFDLPRALWKKLVSYPEKRLSGISREQLHHLAQKLEKDTYHIRGKTTHKEEFVTCGGIDLKEVNFKTMESKIVPGLFFAGEILDIDGVTGGFNFQNAWTTAWIAGNAMCGKIVG